MDIFNVDNSGVVGGVGLILSALGLLGTAIGFVITLVQLSRTKTAADAASEAVGALKMRMAHYDTLAELVAAISAAQETKRHVDSQQWKYALDGLEDLRTYLARMSELSSDTLGSNIEEIKAAISSISIASISLSRQIDRGEITGGLKIRQSLVNCLDLLNRLSIKIQRASR